MAVWHKAAEAGDLEKLTALIAARAKNQQDPFAHLYGDELNEKVN